MRGLKILFGTTALLAGLTLAPAPQAQLVVNIGVQPTCSYGYYGYAPYQCAPMGYYGPGYFYNGIFLGMGPWGGWGYSHGWGGHRFSSEGGGRYHGGPGRVSYRENGGQDRGQDRNQSRGYAAGSNAGGARPSAGHSAVQHSGASHESAPRGGGAGHAGDESHGGGGGGHAGGDSHGGGDHK